MIRMMAVAVVMSRILALAARLRQEALSLAFSAEIPFNLSSQEPEMIQKISGHEVSVAMRRAVVALSFTAVVACAAAFLIGVPSSSLVAAPKQAVFVVPAHDGYDFGDCLTSGGSCGQIVANSWCETQGYTRALSFAPASPEDFTGSLQRVSMRARETAVAITCVK